MAKQETRDEERARARAEDLAKQETTRKLVEKHELEARKEAQKINEEQRRYEATGIRTVEGKP